MTAPSMSPGWYPDVSDRTLERYWDGVQWTPSTRPAVVDLTPVMPAATPVKRSKRFWAVTTVVVLVIIVAVATGLLVKRSSDNHDHAVAVATSKSAAASSASVSKAAVAASRAVASASAAAAASVEASKSAERLDAEVKRTERKQDVTQLESYIKKDAEKDVKDGLLDGPAIKGVDCTPMPGSDALGDLSLSSGSFSCVAYNKVTADGTESGYAFQGTINFDSGQIGWHLGNS